MGRKPIEDKRVQMNRYVAGGTPALVKNLAERMGISEGKVLDEAVQRLDITESLYEKVSSLSPVEKPAAQVFTEDVLSEADKEMAIKPKFTPPTNLRFQRRTK